MFKISDMIILLTTNYKIIAGYTMINNAEECYRYASIIGQNKRAIIAQLIKTKLKYNFAWLSKPFMMVHFTLTFTLNYYAMIYKLNEFKKIIIHTY